MRCLDPAVEDDGSHHEHAGDEEEVSDASHWTPTSPQTESSSEDEEVEITSENFAGLAADLARARAEGAERAITIAALE